MKTLSISIHDPNNLGDQVCNPTDYFHIPDVVKVDAWDLGAWADDKESNMIFGGGGLIHGVLAEAIRCVNRNPNRKLIAWGLGHNQHGETTNDYGGTLDGFDLIGVRDFKRAALQGWDYVPCASCMSEEFGMKILQDDPRDFVSIYSHRETPVSLKAPCSFRCWRNDAERLSSVLRFMSRSEIIITNTYHGAYWAMLLNRGVIIFKPFSSRFYDFEHQPKFCDESNWKDTSVLRTSDGFLEHCRDLNRKFYEKVKTTLGLHGDRTADGHSDSRYSGIAGGTEDSQGGAKLQNDHPAGEDVLHASIQHDEQRSCQ